MLDCALLIVDDEGTVEYRNRAAAAFLKDGNAGLNLTRGVLSAKALGMRERLMQAIRHACFELRPSGLCLPQADARPESWPRLIVAPIQSGVPPDHPRAAVWILNTEAPALPSEDILSALFRLSPAEARLAIGLLRGDSAADCARTAGVGLATIRSQLHSIFNKTGVRRQAQLVALLARVPMLRLVTAAG